MTSTHVWLAVGGFLGGIAIGLIAIWWRYRDDDDDDDGDDRWEWRHPEDGIPGVAPCFAGEHPRAATFAGPAALGSRTE